MAKVRGCGKVFIVADELKNCPICNCEAELVVRQIPRNQDMAYSYYVRCMNPGCAIGLTENVNRQEAINRWNIRAVPEVEDCANWHEISMVQGGHCYNCTKRNGWPYRARPSTACENFSV